MSRQNDGERIRGIANSLVVRHFHGLLKMWEPYQSHFDSWKGPSEPPRRGATIVSSFRQLACISQWVINRWNIMKYTSLYHVLAFMNCSWDTLAAFAGMTWFKRWWWQWWQIFWSENIGTTPHHVRFFHGVFLVWSCFLCPIETAYGWYLQLPVAEQIMNSLRCQKNAHPTSWSWKKRLFFWCYPLVI